MKTLNPNDLGKTFLVEECQKIKIEDFLKQYQNKLKEIGIEENNVAIDLTFDPPWSMEKMTKKGKAMLGIT